VKKRKKIFFKKKINQSIIIYTYDFVGILRKHH